jgi:hypothetical protein
MEEVLMRWLREWPTTGRCPWVLAFKESRRDCGCEGRQISSAGAPMMDKVLSFSIIKAESPTRN